MTTLLAPALEFHVDGLPAPQGSKRHVGGGRMVESSKKVKPWRQDVVTAARAAIDMAVTFETFTGPVRVRVVFYLPRPKSHYRSGANAHLLKASAPPYVAVKPDVDKLLRSTFDALSTAGVWRDDNQAVIVHTEKVYADRPGARLEIRAAAVTA